MEFKEFAQLVQKRLLDLTKKENIVYKSKIEKPELWQLYLNSFPEGTNPIFRNATEFDCRCCASFITNVGRIVVYINGKHHNIWQDLDIPEGDKFKVVADALARELEKHDVSGVYLSTEKRIGKPETQDAHNPEITWNHFWVDLPAHLVVSSYSIGTLVGQANTELLTFTRALDEFTADAVTTVQELIATQSILRGESYEHMVEGFAKFYKEYHALPDDVNSKRIYTLEKCPYSHFRQSQISHIRNSAIGALLIDISENTPLEVAVKSYEDKVSGVNYKRPTPLVTPRMLEEAVREIKKLGYENSLTFRHACMTDININDIIYADKSAKKSMKNSAGLNGILDQVKDELDATPKQSLDKMETITLEKLIKDILPGASKLEILFSRNLQRNLMNLYKAESDKTILKWGNPFSWSYTGGFADSVKERVKQAGGNVDGDIRISLSWFNTDDLDLHLRHQESGTIISYNNRCPSNFGGGSLDVDMNNGHTEYSTNPVENICFPEAVGMRKGTYEVSVHQYTQRNTADYGFEIEYENKVTGEIKVWSYSKLVKDNDLIQALVLYSDGEGNITIKETPLGEGSANTYVGDPVWGITTGVYQRVSTLMLSPNYWVESSEEGRGTGLRHYFFLIDGCKNPEDSRAFYNEYLHPSLEKHRRVFELLGSRAKVSPEGGQLAGIGFTAGKNSSFHVRVTGSYTREYKVILP